MPNGGDEKKRSKPRRDSSATEDALKKGPWTSAEDAILVEYVTKHGEGNWNAVQKHSGLSRCGKSCRLRWANHLRPDLRKGAFTADEERLIIELHAKMGNKWARMAAEMPGRTDNEIKNYWNTRIKRLQRAGLPIYPPEICSKIREASQESMGTNGSADSLPDPAQNHHREIPELNFKSLKINRGVLSYLPNLLDVPGSSFLKQGTDSAQNYGFVLPALAPPPKRLRADNIYPNVDGNVVNSGFPTFSQFADYACDRIPEEFGCLSSQYDSDAYDDQPPMAAVLPGSHAFLNDDSSSSEPISRAMKLELPSLQYSETQQLDSWGTSASPLLSAESVDTLIQTPPTEQNQSECFSPRSSGLLEAVLYQSQMLGNLNCSSVDPGDMMNPIPLNLQKRDWEGQADPNSPLGHPAASLFNECTPMSGSSLDEPGYETKPEMGSRVSTSCVEDKDGSSCSRNIDLSRPDVLLGLGSCFGLSYGGSTKDEHLQTDAVGGSLD